MSRFLVARFDVSGLSERELDHLILEVSAQAERSDEHSSVPSPSIDIEDEAQVAQAIRFLRGGA